MNAVDYFKYKKKLVPDIIKAYNKLSEMYDIIVIEGAGSPAEINLKQDEMCIRDRYETVVTAIITAIVGGLIGYFVKMLGF